MAVEVLVRRRGLVSGIALAASGAGIALRPSQAARVLGLLTASGRGIAETRIGLGGTFAGLGIWSVVRHTPDGYRAVGATWLGAAVTRVVTLRVDEPDPDWTFWAFLAGEITLGLAGLTASARRSGTTPTG